MGRPPVPAPRPVVYLDNACMGRLDSAVMSEVHGFVNRLDVGVTPPTDLIVELHGWYARARDAVARLVHAGAADIALVESTSHGLGLVARALPLEPGDNVLACDLEFFPTVLCWTARCRELGVEVREVATRGGRIEAEDFARHLDARTRAIVVSSVQEINGFRADVRAIGLLARDHDAFLIVDGVQEVGALTVDLPALGVDAYCAGGHKWLQNPFGMGFLYLGERLRDRLQPDFYGYFNTEEPAGGWGEYLSSPARSPFDSLQVTCSTCRFETGGFGNYLGAMVLARSVERQLEIGPAHIEERIRTLRARLAEGLEGLGGDCEGGGVVGGGPRVEVRSSAAPEEASGIITFGLSTGRPGELALGDRLADRGMIVCVRYTSGVGGVRVSPHYYNTDEDVDALVDMVKDCVDGGSHDSARTG